MRPSRSRTRSATGRDASRYAAPPVDCANAELAVASRAKASKALRFILVVFVIVFPLWIVALAVVGLILVIVVGADKLALAMNIHSLSPLARAIRIAFRWVLTFGGLARSQAEHEADVPSPRL
jgi:hypothetical protein